MAAEYRVPLSSPPSSTPPDKVIIPERLPVLEREVTYAEIAGESTGEVRGMPLGLPPMSLEDIQLVESWIAQGRPR